MSAPIRVLRTADEIEAAGMQAGARDGEQAAPQVSARLAVLLSHARVALSQDDQQPKGAA
ncbi:MAG: hypothetical protein J2P30_06665 [Actinobacteria bacterium]|nr:hypothetical protein [Actinomycetota bacterium]